MFEKYQKIQKNFAESIQVKDELQNIRKEMNDHKFKIVIFD